MPKLPSWPALAFPERPEGVRLSDWLHRELRTAILEKRLAPNAKLPSSRSLARQLGMARGTVSAVYEELAAEGYVSARTGDGTRVLPTMDAREKTTSGEIGSTFAKTTGRLLRLSSSAIAWQKSPFPVETTAPRAFRANIPSVSDFPLETWSRLTTRRLRLVTRELLLECDPLGYLPLREAIAIHLRETRGVNCSGEQVMIVSGTQMALDLTGRMLVDPGDAVWVEDPGYPGASALLGAAGARIIPIPVDSHGMQVEKAIRQAPAARLAVVTATHHFPLGVTLSLPRRMALLQWAVANEAWIFEDDYDSEFRFSGKPQMGMQGIPGGEKVLLCGSFSKMLYPGIRLGFVVLPQGLVEPFRSARSLIDRFPACLEQAVLADFIGEGHFERHLRRMRMKYLERYTTLVEVSREVWGDRLVVDTNSTGLQAMAWLGGGKTAEWLGVEAAKLGYEFVPLSRYVHTARKCLGHSVASGVQVGFGALSPSELKTAIHAVGKIL